MAALRWSHRKGLIPEEAANQLLEAGERCLRILHPGVKWWILPQNLLPILISLLAAALVFTADALRWNVSANGTQFLSFLMAIVVFTNLAYARFKLTLYVLSDRRLLIRVGKGKTFAYPYEMIESVRVKTFRDGSGNVRLRMKKGFLNPNIRIRPALLAVREAKALRKWLEQKAGIVK